MREVAGQEDPHPHPRPVFRLLWEPEGFSGHPPATYCLCSPCPWTGFKLAFNYLKAKRFVEAIEVCHKVSLVGGSVQWPCVVAGSPA